MLLQNIHAVGHRSHDVDKTGTVRAEVFEHRAQQVQVALLVHLIENLNDGVHRLTFVVEFLDAPFLHTECLLNQVVLTLYAGKQLIESSGCDFWHQTHSIGSRTESQQFIGRYAAHVSQTIQSL